MEKFREPVNAWTHLIGALLSLVGMVAMLILIISENNVTPETLCSVLAFGIGLIGLYYTSFYYHAVQNRGGEELLRLKKLDHAMIFLLIAGSYTPFCLLCLTGPMRIGMMAAIWGVAIIGILMMVFWIGMPRWLNTTLYIALGWFALFALKPLYEALPTGGFVLLILGGILYTIGGVMYGLKKPNLSQRWGFHEIFHIFVLLGSACHFAAVFRYLLMV
ncbi:PAQR family membrane homeostasis protein TrhA [Eubacterium aggregans]|uniref:PAQR family membrane homeostasis protein TrhA n=1 Tax=Eubacterium aggregans TaxID=81409 RepID=UPI0023F1360C|nr:hemolysin III family protein [Eubacterium aggregans]MDD4691417.1 hemolysin III family protein [Eubacterium aggregans]